MAANNGKSSPGTVQFGFSNPVNVGSGFSQAYFQTATFSGGRFTSVQGAYAPLGIPLGSSSGNSSILQWFLNGNSSTASQAQNFGNLMTSFASLVSRNGVAGRYFVEWSLNRAFQPAMKEGGGLRQLADVLEASVGRGCSIFP